MYAARRIWLALGIIVAALIVLDLVGPALSRAVPRSSILAEVVVAIVVVYIVGTIVAANRGMRIRLPQIRRPRRLRPVRRETDAASKFIEEFERRNRR